MINKVTKTIIEFLQIILPFILLIFVFSFIFFYLSNMNFEMAISIPFMFSYFLFGLAVLGIFSSLLASKFIPEHNKFFVIITYFCLFFIFISLINQELQIIKSSGKIFSLKNFWLKCENPSNLIEILSCITTGYMPSKQSNITETLLIIYGFWIYGFVIPIIVLYNIFKDFIGKSGVIGNSTYAEIITICFTLIAYRGFVITRLVDLLSIGLLGAGLIIINLLIFFLVIKKLPRYFLSKPKERTDELKSKVKLELEGLKKLPLNQINIVFAESIRENLRTLLEAKGKSEKFLSLVENLNLAKDKNEAIKAINAMIAEIS
ncbi:MAG: hypothetical protein QXM68_01735 [Candidatus Aenigmatarchaeota archaeon]